MIFFSLLYYFIQYFSGHPFEFNTRLHLKKLKTNHYHYGMKKNDSKESLDQYFLLTSSNELSLNQKKSNDKREGYDERYSIYNSSLTLNNPNVSYKIKLEEYKSLLRIKLFFLKQKFRIH